MLDRELHVVQEIARGVFGTLLAPCSTRVLPYLLVPAPTSFVWLVTYHPHHVLEWLDLPLPLAPDTPPATWPDPSVPQQMHLDVMVDDLPDARRRVEQLGARHLQGDVYADPAGHPFCLIPRPGWAPPVG